MYEATLSALTAFALTYLVIPSIIFVAHFKHLFDEPGERRSHTENTPSLGGIGIFVGVVFSVTLWTPVTAFGDLQYILCAFVIIFLIGAKDDIIPMPPYKKIIGQILAAGIVVFKSGIFISSFYGVFGVQELSPLISFPFSVFTILVIINSFNLIDGINGLSGSIGLLTTLLFGSWFLLIDELALAILAFATAGALIAFLRYNITPAKIFMGDTGSLLLGMVCSILVIQFIEISKTLPLGHPYKFSSVPALAVGILILPLFDTLRVFVVRVFRGRSPLQPDRNHIHHLLIDFGFSHMQATSLLLLINIGFIILVHRLQYLGTVPLLLLVLLLAFLLSGGFYLLVRRHKA